MAGPAAAMPDIKSGKLMQISELSSWQPDSVHGCSVRLLGRVQSTDYANSTIEVEYHGKRLAINIALLGDAGQFRQGMLFQFLGELDKINDKLLLKARIARDMSSLDSDLYDRCLKARRDFEQHVLNNFNS